MQPMDEKYQQYAQMVYEFLLSRTCNSYLVEELTQELLPGNLIDR